MKALVTTASMLLLIDLETAEVQILEADRPCYYGITWTQDGQKLILAHIGLFLTDLTDISAYAQSEKGYLSIGQENTGPFLSQPHQILCADNNWIVITNTGRNCITIFDPISRFSKELMVNNVRWDRLSPTEFVGEHFNSVFIKDGYLYVLSHGFHKHSYILQFSYPECELINQFPIKRGSGFHNIWIDDSKNIFSCNSSSSELVEVKTNDVIWKSHLPFYLRGLSITQDMIVIGASEINERKHRHSKQNSGLWLIDRKNFATIDFIPLNIYGDIREVRILDVADEAHHGKIFKNISELEKLNYNQTKKQEILTLHREKTVLHPKIDNYYLIAGELNYQAEEWSSSINDELTILLAKTQPKNFFMLSADYSFQPATTHKSEKNFSLVFGYQGPHDTNMIVVLLNKTYTHVALSIWRNAQGNWKQIKEILSHSVYYEGHLEVLCDNTLLKIMWNNLYYEVQFSPEDLVGNVGIRFKGSQFKNFILEEDPNKINQKFMNYFKKNQALANA